MVSQPRQGPIPPGSRYYTLAFAAPTPLGSLQSSPKPPVRRRGRDGRAEEEREREGKEGGGEKRGQERGICPYRYFSVTTSSPEEDRWHAYY